MEAGNDGTTEAPWAEYVQLLWGDLIVGTKEQLQALGIGIGRAFPGEVGGPSSHLNVRDPRGYAVKVSAPHKLDDQSHFTAYLTFPHWPERPSLFRDPWQPSEAGVKMRKCLWFDEYRGRAEPLIAAGLVLAHQLPGRAGMPKNVVRLLPDGSLVQRPKLSRRAQETAGFRWIERASPATYSVNVTVDEAEQKARRARSDSAERQWEAEVSSRVRPAPLKPLMSEQLATFAQACAMAARDLRFQGMLARMVAPMSKRPL